MSPFIKGKFLALFCTNSVKNNQHPSTPYLMRLEQSWVKKCRRRRHVVISRFTPDKTDFTTSLCCSGWVACRRCRCPRQLITCGKTFRSTKGQKKALFIEILNSSISSELFDGKHWNWPLSNFLHKPQVQVGTSFGPFFISIPERRNG